MAVQLTQFACEPPETTLKAMLEGYSFDDALSAYTGGRIGLTRLHEYMREWCVGKADWKYDNGIVWEWIDSRFGEGSWCERRAVPRLA
jgi:hypothetical protein